MPAQNVTVPISDLIDDSRTARHEGEKEWKGKKEREGVKEGMVVSVAYDGTTRAGIPIGARVFRVRKDVSWAEILLRDAMDTGSEVLNSRHVSSASSKNSLNGMFPYFYKVPLAHSLNIINDFYHIT